jgi:ketosteroid isomerase-like protein
MSQENVEVVRSFYDAWERDEFPGPVELMDAEIEYVNPPGAVEPGTRRGPAEFSSAVGNVFERWETWKTEPEEFRPVGDGGAVWETHMPVWWWLRMPVPYRRGTMGSEAR